MSSQVFSTADMGQAAYLMSWGHPFLGSRSTGHQRVEFTFSELANGKSASSRALEYANGGEAPAKTLLDSFRFLKSVLKDCRNQTRSGEESAGSHR
jgi:hypothetical protein